MEPLRNTPQDDWVGAPISRPYCPIHGVREDAHVVEKEGVGMIEFTCPVDDCDHSWIVKRLRV